MSNRQTNQSPERNSNTQQTSNGQKLQTVKLVLLGDQGVGKSSIALRFVRGEFNEHGEATIGAAFLTQTINVSGPGQSVKFDIWDTAGQERYHSLAPMYYRGAQAAIVVYDITNAKSFNSAITWVSELRQQANSQIVVVLAGNKADMAAEKRVVAREEGENLAQENNLVFIETSAKTGMHVPEIFMSIAQSTGRQSNVVRDNKGIKLGGKEKKKGKCC
ncbi:hypothetical protein ACJMK2_013229 [Sinanodonta woodiana]|uniref:Uncharacterized protein n=1 Tax=Sinanodonta woodiana TaxID=1069815 RepID=A0ABD3UWV0_SINWO